MVVLRVASAPWDFGWRCAGTPVLLERILLLRNKCSVYIFFCDAGVPCHFACLAIRGWSFASLVIRARDCVVEALEQANEQCAFRVFFHFPKLSKKAEYKNLVFVVGCRLVLCIFEW